MSTTEQRFQSFITRVRPHRIAVFTNAADVHWQDSCVGVLEFLTKLWGGSHCVIIPTDGKQIDEEFWAILSSYDPDLFYKYQPTGADLKIRDPAEFDKLVSDEVVKYAAASGLAEDRVRDYIEKEISKAHFDEWGVMDELKQQLLIRLAPFHFDKQINIYNITRGLNPHYPLTKITDVLRAIEKPKNVIQIERDAEVESAPPPLWLAATIGSGDQQYFTEMNSIDICSPSRFRSASRPPGKSSHGESIREHICKCRFRWGFQKLCPPVSQVNSITAL